MTLLAPATVNAQFMMDTMAAAGAADTLGAGQAINAPTYINRARDASDTAKSYADIFQSYTARNAGGDMLGNIVDSTDFDVNAMHANINAGIDMAGNMANNTPTLTPMMQFMRSVQGVSSTADNALNILAFGDDKIEYVTVLTGERVLCAVTGQMLQDVDIFRVKVDKDNRDEGVKAWASEQNIEVTDDGINDNGIAGDGIYGNVTINNNSVISPEANRLRGILLRILHQVEYLAPSTVIDYASMTKRQAPPALELGKSGIVIDATSGKITNYSQATQSIMRFFLLHIASEGLPEPNPAPAPWLDKSTPKKQLTLLEMERMRDDYLREWQSRFLAAYRLDPEDPRSEYYPVYIPKGPAVPEIDQAYIGGAIKLSAITGQGFPIIAMRPEVTKEFIRQSMSTTLAEMAPEEIPDPAAERVRVPMPANYRPPQERKDDTGLNSEGGAAAGVGAGAAPGMPGIGGPAGPAMY